MLSLNNNVFPFRVMDCLTNSMDGKASFKLQVFVYRFDGSAFLYLLECISVVHRLCFPGNMCACWVLTGFCRAVCLQQQRRQTWRTTTSALPSGTPSRSPSLPCWWGAGMPVPRWVPLLHTARKAAGKWVFLLWPTICLTSYGFLKSPSFQGKGHYRKPWERSWCMSRNTEELANWGGK